MPDKERDTKPERVIGYIDGFNLYFGMRASKLHRRYWLDQVAMLRGLLRQSQQLVGVKYFTARVSFPPDKVKRQGEYLDALRTVTGLEIIYGQYEGEPDVCENCGSVRIDHGEKMTDVNIAVEVTKDAYADRFDAAFLITGDSDQTPTIRLVKELFPAKRVVVVFPPSRVSNRLRQVAHAYIHLKDHHLSKAQLPEQITLPSGYLLKRPAEWS